MRASEKPINIASVFDNLKMYFEINTPIKKSIISDRKYPNKSKKSKYSMGARAKNSMHNAGIQTSMTNLLMAKAAATSKVRILPSKKPNAPIAKIGKTAELK